MQGRGFEIAKGYEDKDIHIPIRKTAPQPIAVAAATAPATAFGRTARTLNARTTARAAVMILFFIPIFLSR